MATGYWFDDVVNTDGFDVRINNERNHGFMNKPPPPEREYKNPNYFPVRIKKREERRATPYEMTTDDDYKASMLNTIRPEFSNLFLEKSIRELENFRGSRDDYSMRLFQILTYTQTLAPNGLNQNLLNRLLRVSQREYEPEKEEEPAIEVDPFPGLETEQDDEDMTHGPGDDDGGDDGGDGDDDEEAKRSDPEPKKKRRPPLQAQRGMEGVDQGRVTRATRDLKLMGRWPSNKTIKNEKTDKEIKMSTLKQYISEKRGRIQMKGTTYYYIPYD